MNRLLAPLAALGASFPLTALADGGCRHAFQSVGCFKLSALLFSPLILIGAGLALFATNAIRHRFQSEARWRWTMLGAVLSAPVLVLGGMEATHWLVSKLPLGDTLHLLLSATGGVAAMSLYLAATWPRGAARKFDTV